MKKAFLILVALIAASVLSAASITVVSPNGGENWQQGSVQRIRWSATGFNGKVHVILYQGSTRIGSVVRDINVSLGYYDWKVGQFVSQNNPFSPGSGFKVQVVATAENNFNPSDMSDGEFTISALNIDWARLRDMIKKFMYKPDPFPGCPQCFMFDLKPWLEELIKFRKFNKIDDDIAWRIELRTGGAKLIELGTIGGRGAKIPADGKLKLSLNDNQRSKLQSGNLMLVILDARGKTLTQILVQAEQLK